MQQSMLCTLKIVLRLQSHYVEDDINVNVRLHIVSIGMDKSITPSEVMDFVFLGRQRRPYIVFRFRYSYGFMFVCIYIFLSFCKWRHSRQSLQTLKSSLMAFRRILIERNVFKNMC